MSFAVELVSPSQRVWSGQAEMVSARTIDGDLGILSGHTQLFGVLVDGTVTIKGTDGTTTDFNISGGFLSVANNRVSILTESVG
jgi:F-type H+-transporting ATPase subunit epsilon